MVTRIGDRWAFRALVAAAQSVHVVGDFNGWNPVASPMSPSGPAEWLLQLELEPGVHHFRYLVDARRWLADYAAFGLSRNRQGEWESILYVPTPSVICRTETTLTASPFNTSAVFNGKHSNTYGRTHAMKKSAH